VANEGWRVYEALDGADWTGLTDSEKMLVALGELRTEVNNGGFNQYFFNTAGDHGSWAVRAGETIELAELVDIVNRAMRTLGPEYPSDWATRQGRVVALSDESNATLDTLDGEYFELEAVLSLDETMDSLAARRQGPCGLEAVSPSRRSYG